MVKINRCTINFASSVRGVQVGDEFFIAIVLQGGGRTIVDGNNCLIMGNKKYITFRKHRELVLLL